MPRKTEEKNETSKIEKKTSNVKNAKSKTSSTSKKSIKAEPKQKREVSKKTKKSVKSSTNTKSKTSTTKKASSSKSKTVSKSKSIEYYDLPEKYNKTIVKVLAQTPKMLFIYWEISDDDIKKYKKEYGDNFFEITKPVLIVHNKTLNYSFEVEINDFANSWYLHINDSKSDYSIELGRRPIQNNNENITNNYVYITKSNKIESPNDHILFNPSQKMFYFRNVKTNIEFGKSISSISFIKNIGKIYNIYDLYKEIYKNEDDLENLQNPSSMHLN